MSAISESLLALFALVILYILLIGDWFHRAWAALGVAGALVVSGVLPWRDALLAIDWNTVELLAGMMVLVGILGEAGLFLRLGRWARERAGGQPWRLLWIFYGLTAVVSAVLDNVTTVLLLSPALIRAAEEMDLDPVPLLMVEVVASNLGGLATLIGDPPNILIGTAANLSFLQFVRYLGPAAILLLGGVAVILPRVVRLAPEPKAGRTAAPAPAELSPRPPLAARLPGLLGILGLVLTAFVLQRRLGISPGLIAVFGALLALGFARPPLKPLIKLIDWGTLGFFVGIFVLVGGLDHSGLIHALAMKLTMPAWGPWLPLLILGGSAVFSAFLDNVPLVAALIPLLAQIMVRHPGYGLELWLALALGAAIGGNGTIIGASANVVVQGLAYEYGYPLDFRRFAAFGLKVAGLTLLLGAGYLVLRF